MKLEPHLLQFPKYIPNDLEGFILFYPNKYPGVVTYYKDLAKRIGADPKAFEKYRDDVKQELFAGVAKIKKDYEAGNQSDLAFLVDIDMRINKLFCYRFWVINYLFADGPLHNYYVDTLKALISKFVDVTDDIEEYENKIAQIQRDLLQSDFADYYLREAFESIEVANLLKNHPRVKNLVVKAEALIGVDASKNYEAINRIWNEVITMLKEDKANKQSSKILEFAYGPTSNPNVKTGSMYPVYNSLTMAIEFLHENVELQARHGEMSGKIKEILGRARQKLSNEDYALLELSYLQARNFIKSKDEMGDVDKQLLPMWFGLHSKAREIIIKQRRGKPFAGGHCEMFYSLTWYLPPELKDKIWTIDKEPYSLETV